MLNSTLYFSICIPTRNRTETLLYCLKTLLHQNFDSYEIIVSDNSDEEESKKTYEIIQTLNSSRLKYYKQNSILSMTENYEFALSKASGKYILCMGDDDGLIVDSLQYVYDFIQKYNAEIVKCPRVGYGWIGSHWNPDSILAYPLERPVIKVNSKSILEKVANFELRYSNLPMIYYSFVNKKIIDEVVREKGSFFQNSASIDMYSGFIIAYKSEDYFITDKPFVIMGSSTKSNGALGMADPNHSIVKEYLIKHNLIEYYHKYKIPMFPKLVLSSFVWLELLKFMDNYHLDKSYLNIEHRNLFLNMISSNPVFDKKENLGMAEDFKQYSEYDSDIKELKENFIGKEVYFPNFNNEETELCQYKSIDPRLFGVKDVYDAAILCRQILNSKKTLHPIPLSENLLAEYKKNNTVPKRSLKTLLKIGLKRIIPIKKIK